MKETFVLNCAIIFFALCMGMFLTVTVCTSISTTTTTSNVPRGKFDVKRCYVTMGNKYSIFNENDYQMTISMGTLYVSRKSDGHLMIATSSFTGVCDDSVDPNMDVKTEKE